MAATAMLVVALDILVTPKYVANAFLLVLLSADYSFQPAANSETLSAVVMERESFLKSEVQILESSFLGKVVLGKIGVGKVYPELAAGSAGIGPWFEYQFRSWSATLGWRAGSPPIDLAADKFARNLTAAPDKAGNIIVVSFRHRDPAIAADVVNTLIASYLARRAELFSDIRSPVMAEQAHALSLQLDRASADFAEFKLRYGISDYKTQLEILLHQKGEVSHDLQLAENEIAQVVQRLAVTEKQLDEMPHDSVNYHNVQSVVRRGPITLLDTLTVDAAHENQALEAAKARRETDTRQLVQIQESITLLERNKAEFDLFERRRNLIEQNYRNVVKAFDDNKFQEDVNSKKGGNVRVIQRAEVPINSGSLRLVILAAGLMLSLLVGMSVAVLSNNMRRGYISTEKLEQELGLPVLARLPLLPYQAASPLGSQRKTLASAELARVWGDVVDHSQPGE